MDWMLSVALLLSVDMPMRGLSKIMTRRSWARVSSIAKGQSYCVLPNP